MDSAKAVSDGAVIWRCMQNVGGRRARFSYGKSTSKTYDPSDPNTVGRVRQLSTVSRKLKIYDCWEMILRKVWSILGLLSFWP